MIERKKFSLVIKSEPPETVRTLIAQPMSNGAFMFVMRKHDSDDSGHYIEIFSILTKAEVEALTAFLQGKL